ncbi:MAG TPA: RidA family protein, partial [Candidatus Angelobacter sp.]|nr:RidA family protein [Candidatus Angelobacter sp.]
MKFLQPPNWPRPIGYSNGVAAKGNLVFLSGIVGWN